MNWIKKNPAQFSLALISVLLLVSAVMVYSSISEFPTKVKAEAPAGTKRKDLPKPEVKEMEAAQALVSTPGSWQADLKTHASIFVSRPFVLNNGILVNPKEGTFNPPVPNEWLSENDFDPTLASVLDEDPDGDGFSNLREWLGVDGLAHLKVQPGTELTKIVLIPVLGADGKPLPADSTNPKDPKSFPPYHTRLEVAQINNISFLLKFMSADVERNGTVTAALNTVNLGDKTHFIPLPGKIPGTKFTAKSYKEIIKKLADGDEKDVSELTIENDETKELIVLPKGVVVDSPESNVDFRYLWGQPLNIATKKKGQTFSLPPETQKQYKVVEIKTLTTDAQKRPLTGEVTLAMPSGQNQVFKFPAPK